MRQDLVLTCEWYYTIYYGVLFLGAHIYLWCELQHYILGCEQTSLFSHFLTDKTWRLCSLPLLSLSLCVCRNTHGIMVKNLPANAGDTEGSGSIPGSGRSPGGGNVYPLQHSCLENSIDRGWQATVLGVTKSQTRQSMHVPMLSPLPIDILK